jgi:F0F1-type ATP synthase beta subunit
MPIAEAPTARYRRLARECLEVANTFRNGDQRDALLQMAAVWTRLADHHADSTMPFLPSVQGEQPAVQQQQQIQPKDEDKDRAQ